MAFSHLFINNLYTKNMEKENLNRFVLFCGNLPFTCDEDRLKTFFKPICDETRLKTRLLTKKGSGEPKGCAFVEFSDGKECKKALKLHHSMMDGRQVNVELTAGGGGGGESRQKKIKVKQRNLKKERKADFAETKLKDNANKIDVQENPRKKKKKPKENTGDPRVAVLAEKYKLNNDGKEYLTRQPSWLIDQIESDFRLPEEEVRDVTGLLIKFSQGAKQKAYEAWSWWPKEEQTSRPDESTMEGNDITSKKKRDVEKRISGTDFSKKKKKKKRDAEKHISGTDFSKKKKKKKRDAEHVGSIQQPNVDGGVKKKKKIKSSEPGGTKKKKRKSELGSEKVVKKKRTSAQEYVMCETPSS